MHSILTFSEFVLITDSLFEPKHAEPVFVQTFAEFVAYQESILSEQGMGDLYGDVMAQQKKAQEAPEAQAAQQDAAQKQQELAKNKEQQLSDLQANSPYQKLKAAYEDEFGKALTKSNFNARILQRNPDVRNELIMSLQDILEYQDAPTIRYAEEKLLNSDLFKKALNGQNFFNKQYFSKLRNQYHTQLQASYQKMMAGVTSFSKKDELEILQDPNVKKEQLDQLYKKYFNKIKKIREPVVAYIKQLGLNKGFISQQQHKMLELHYVLGGEEAFDNLAKKLAFRVIDSPQLQRYLSNPQVQKFISRKLPDIVAQLKKAGVVSNIVKPVSFMTPANTIQIAKKELAEIQQKIKTGGNPQQQKIWSDRRFELKKIINNLGNQAQIVQGLAAASLVAPEMQNKLVSNFIQKQKAQIQAQTQEDLQKSGRATDVLKNPFVKLRQGFRKTMGAIGRGWQAISNS